MIQQLKESLWKQFGASIDMLGNAITFCPEEILQSNKRLFYTTYHVLVFLDYYLTIPPPNGFSASLSFTLKEPAEIPEEALDDVIPDRFYTKQELLNYLIESRKKCYRIISGLTEEKLEERFREDFPGGMDYSTLEILLYNMRHVQHHTAQLNLLLRQIINTAPKWIGRAEENV